MPFWSISKTVRFSHRRVFEWSYNCAQATSWWYLTYFLQFPSSCSSWWWHENVNECKLELLQGGCSQGEPGHALKDPESHLKYLLDAPVISVILVIIILRSNYPCLVCINIRYTVSTVSWYIAFCTPPPCLFTVPSLIVWRVTDFWFYADPSLIPSNLIMISCGCDNAAILGTKCQIRVSQGILTLPPHILTLQGRSVWNMYPNYIHWIELNWILFNIYMESEFRAAFQMFR